MDVTVGIFPAPSQCPLASSAAVVGCGCGRQEGTSRSTLVTEAHYLETVYIPTALHKVMQELQSQASILQVNTCNDSCICGGAIVRLPQSVGPALVLAGA